MDTLTMQSLLLLFHLKRMANDYHIQQAFAFLTKTGANILKWRNYVMPLPMIWAPTMRKSSMPLCRMLTQTSTANMTTMNISDHHISYEEFTAIMKAGINWRKAREQLAKVTGFLAKQYGSSSVLGHVSPLKVR
ncbi:hypothetical protein RJ641_005065 [Dillenia turbinata]|uniref:Uncharacterized protein n=1 Tax=Dillenia turbinata TaxID=194707 RepID=A0AAN8ZB56_9MAGN